MFQKKSKLSDLDTAKASKEILSPEKGTDKLDELKEREQRISQLVNSMLLGHKKKQESEHRR